MSSSRYLALYRPVEGGIYDASGFISGGFGAPDAIWDQFSAASGSSSTQFGVPTARLTQPASGFYGTQLGTPDGYKLQRAEGFSPILFGTPRLFPSHVGPGVHTTLFGTPSAQQFWRAMSWSPIARLGTPTTPTDRSAQASGFAPVRLGLPQGSRTLPPDLTQSERAFGARTTLFGTPSARWAQAGQASALGPVVQFGTPVASGVHHADGVAMGAQFGTALVRLKQNAAGLYPVHFGSPGSTITQRASGLAPTVRFGLPTTVRSNWYEVRGFVATRCGQPIAYQRNNYHATGLGGTLFGTPSCRQRYRASALAPITRFGTPLLKRITQC